MLLSYHVDCLHFLTSICWVNTVLDNVWHSKVFVNMMSSNSHWTFVYDSFFLYLQEKVCIWKLHCEGGAVFSSPCLSSFPHHLYVATLGGLLLAVNPVCTFAYMSFILISSLNETKCSEFKTAILMKGKMIIHYHEIFFAWGHYNDIQGYHNSSHKSEIYVVIRRTAVTCLNSHPDPRPKLQSVSCHSHISKTSEWEQVYRFIACPLLF